MQITLKDLEVPSGRACRKYDKYTGKKLQECLYFASGSCDLFGGTTPLDSCLKQDECLKACEVGYDDGRITKIIFVGTVPDGEHCRIYSEDSGRIEKECRFLSCCTKCSLHNISIRKDGFGAEFIKCQECIRAGA